jgi:hypothetical protein
MGEKRCAVDGCNALEFRSTGICNRHRSMGVESLEDAQRVVIEKKVKKDTKIKTRKSTKINWGEVAKFGVAAAMGVAAFNNRQGQDGAFTGAFSAAASAYKGDFASAVDHGKSSNDSKTYSCTCGYAIQGGNELHASPKCPRCNKMMIQGGHRVISSVAQCSNCGATISSHSGIIGKCIVCSKQSHMPVTGNGSYSCQCGVIERANSYAGNRKCSICGRQMTFKR